MFITKFNVGNVSNPHYKIEKLDDKVILYKTDIPTNGNTLNVKCELEYEQLSNAVKFCYAFASEKNGMYPDKWIDPVIVNSFYEGLFTFEFTGNPQYLIENTLMITGGHNNIKNLVIFYGRGTDYFKQPVILPKVSDFEIKNESNKANLEEKSKDISTQGEGSKDSNLPLKTTELTYMGKLYKDFNGNLILKNE